MHRLFRGVLLLFVLVLVLCIGLVVAERTPPPQPSKTEIALASAASRSADLATTARFIAGQGTPGSADFSALADLLALHAAALQPPPAAALRSSASASPSDGGVPSDGQPSPSMTAPTSNEFLEDLKESYAEAFDAAATAEPGPARLLASVATSQWLQARLLATSQQQDPPAAPVQPQVIDDDASEPCATASGTPDGIAERGTAEDAVEAAVRAEQRAVYAYEVVAARAADPATYLARADAHRGAAVVGSALLAEQCVPVRVPSAAFTLEPQFLSGPDTALQELESALVSTYADLVGLSSPGPVREWAMARLTVSALQASEVTADGATGLREFPGIDPEQYPPKPSP